MSNSNGGAVVEVQRTMTTIDDILASLERRGFYDPTIALTIAWKDATQTQVDAVLEELAEVARKLRRDRQDVSVLNFGEIAEEAADVVIAAVCLLGAVSGDKSSAVIRAKMEADEKRGRLHNGGK